MSHGWTICTAIGDLGSVKHYYAFIWAGTIFIRGFFRRDRYYVNRDQ